MAWYTLQGGEDDCGVQVMAKAVDMVDLLTIWEVMVEWVDQVVKYLFSGTQHSYIWDLILYFNYDMLTRQAAFWKGNYTLDGIIWHPPC